MNLGDRGTVARIMATIRMILSLSREEEKSQNPVNMKTNMTTLYFKTSMARSPLCLRLFLAALALACFAISDRARAVSPPPDGGYGPPAYGVGNTAFVLRSQKRDSSRTTRL